MLNVIHTRASRAEVEAALRNLPRLTTGSPGGAGGFVRALQVRIGLALLQHIKDAFIVKARGGTDVCGDKWAPLSKHTIAYSRLHPDAKKGNVGMRRHKLPGGGTIGHNPARLKGLLHRVDYLGRKNPGLSGYHPSWELSQKNRERWWALYRKFKAKYGGDKRRAAATAWVVLKTEGKIDTIMSKFGNMQVDILRSTDLLFNSLSPGAKADSAPMFPPHVEKQVFRNEPGDVIVGTNRKWSWTHHHGVPGKIPQRRLWPDPSRWTGEWWASVIEQAQKGIAEITAYIVGRIK